MKIEFTGRQTEIASDVRRVAERKLQKLERLLPAGTRAHVVLSADKHRRVAEVSLGSRSLDLVASSVSTDPLRSVSDAVDKLVRQARRRRTRRRAGKGAASLRLAPAPPKPKPKSNQKSNQKSRERVAPEPRLLRQRRALRPMTLEQATLELRELADGVLVFRDAASERLRVLFRRPSGGLGLIEPEG